MRVTAEGVETLEQARALKSMACHGLQGLLLQPACRDRSHSGAAGPQLAAGLNRTRAAFGGAGEWPTRGRLQPADRAMDGPVAGPAVPHGRGLLGACGRDRGAGPVAVGAGPRPAPPRCRGQRGHCRRRGHRRVGPSSPERRPLTFRAGPGPCRPRRRRGDRARRGLWPPWPCASLNTPTACTSCCACLQASGAASNSLPPAQRSAASSASFWSPPRPPAPPTELCSLDAALISPMMSGSRA